MYYDYFGLKQPPFRITPDTNLFFPGGNRGAILEALVYAVVSGEGIIKVAGEVGSGKTMLCRMLQEELPETVEIVYLANPSLSPQNILHAIAFELKLPVQSNSSRLQVMNKLHNYLLQKHSSGQQVVVFVEEAQSMPIATLEEIRLLSNLETQQNKLLQIILFGQPELDQMIGQREIRQLKERITYSFQLNPFKINEIKDYLNARLRACGYRSVEIFNKSAVKEIKRFSNGLVRRINILADKSMLAAYATGTNRVTAKHVRQAARDSEFVTYRWRFRFPALIASLFTLAVVFTYWQLQAKSIGSVPVANNVGATDKIAAAIRHPLRAERAGEAPEQKRESTDSSSQDESAGAHNMAGQTVIKIDNKADKRLNEHVPGESSQELAGPGPVPDEEAGTAVLALDTALTGNRPVESRTRLENHQSPPDLIETGKQNGIEQQLIGINSIFELQALGDTRLTRKEQLVLQRQLRDLPPEAAYRFGLSPAGDRCKLCWSLIYRPLRDHEKL
ncbi:MAG: ExeA family protein [Gammaproteobacteria bacterium]